MLANMPLHYIQSYNCSFMAKQTHLRM